MYYKQYGNKGFKVSAIGFGCMRFDPEDIQAGRLEKCAEVCLYAHEKGINYFDTAPSYCSAKSEKALGIALRQLPRGSFVVSSKTNFGQIEKPITEDGFFRRLENSLKDLGVDYVDVYHLWCMLSPEQYQKQCGTLYGWFLKAKEQGLVKHIAFSSHMQGGDIEGVVAEDKFDAMLIGYNAINHRYRQSGITAAHQKGMAVAAMNPLSGGLIPQNPEYFKYLVEGELTPAQAALRYVAAHKEITITLNGITTKAHVDDAVKAVEGLVEEPAEMLNKKWAAEGEALQSLCTGCGYCDSCPVGVPIPKLMDAYNKKLLGVQDVVQTLNYHWGLQREEAERCVQCGQCEQLCTQHLPIIERIKYIAT